MVLTTLDAERTRPSILVPLKDVVGTAGVLHDMGKILEKSQKRLRDKGRWEDDQLAAFQKLHCDGGAVLIDKFQRFATSAEQYAVLEIAEQVADGHHTFNLPLLELEESIYNQLPEFLQEKVRQQALVNEVTRLIQICDGLQAMLYDGSRDYVAKREEGIARNGKTPQQVYNILCGMYHGREFVTINGVRFNVLESIRRDYNIPPSPEPLAAAAVHASAVIA